MSTKIIGNSKLDEEFYAWYTNPAMNYGDNAAFYEHMPLLRLLCHNKRVVELGSRYGTSTLAILSALPAWLKSYDIRYRETLGRLQQLADEEGVSFTFQEADDLTITIPECDVLFIDTLHTGNQLRQELALHADKACEYIIGHDLVSFGYKDEIDVGSNTPGLIPVLEEFLEQHPEWESVAYWLNCNGLWCLTRT